MANQPDCLDFDDLFADRDNKHDDAIKDDDDTQLIQLPVEDQYWAGYYHTIRAPKNPPNLFDWKTHQFYALLRPELYERFTYGPPYFDGFHSGDIHTVQWKMGLNVSSPYANYRVKRFDTLVTWFNMRNYGPRCNLDLWWLCWVDVDEHDIVKYHQNLESWPYTHYRSAKPNGLVMTERATITRAKTLGELRKNDDPMYYKIIYQFMSRTTDAFKLITSPKSTYYYVHARHIGICFVPDHAVTFNMYLFAIMFRPKGLPDRRTLTTHPHVNSCKVLSDAVIKWSAKGIQPRAELNNLDYPFDLGSCSEMDVIKHYVSTGYIYDPSVTDADRKQFDAEVVQFFYSYLDK